MTGGNIVVHRVEAGVSRDKQQHSQDYGTLIKSLNLFPAPAPTLFFSTLSDKIICFLTCYFPLHLASVNSQAEKLMSAESATSVVKDLYLDEKL